MVDRKITDEQLDAHQAAHRRVKYVRAFGHEWAFRKPSRVEVRMHSVNREAGTHTKVEADTELLQFMLLQADDKTGGDARVVFNATIDDYPMAAASTDFAVPLALLCGVVADDEGKNWGPRLTGNGAPLDRSPMA